MRVAVLGAGEMGRMHAMAYAQLREREHVELAGIFSRSLGRAQKLANEAGGVASSHVRRFLEDDTIDAVDVTVPSAFHGPLVVEALERGKHVFCETPLALTLTDVDAMIAAARRSRRILMVAQVMRFVAPYVALRDRVVSGRIGRPLFAEARRLSRPYWKRDPPRTFAAYGDPVAELMIHDFDLLNWILGTPRAVFASGVVGRGGSVEHAHASLDYGKVKALVEGGGMMPPGYPFSTTLLVRGDRAMLDLSQRFIGEGGPETTFLEYRTRSGPKAVHVRGIDPYPEECRYFVRCVQGKGDPSRLSPQAEREAIRVAVAAQESIRRQQPVRLAS
jgi:predicted dehydrogenase